MADYTLALDPRNPGHYFACCGLLELAETMAPGAEACFRHDARTFTISTDVRLPVRGLRLAARAQAEDNEALEPLIVEHGGGRVYLDWWLNETHAEKSRLKTWGGQQTPRRVLEELLRLADADVSFANLFSFGIYTKTRLGVDARSAWEALDAGYSPNDLNQDAMTYPWVEVLAAVGLQGFRPSAEKSRERGQYWYRYTTWFSPLPLAPARAACAARWAGLPSKSFRFRIAARGQGYKTFVFAEEVMSD